MTRYITTNTPRQVISEMPPNVTVGNTTHPRLGYRIEVVYKMTYVGPNGDLPGTLEANCPEDLISNWAVAVSHNDLVNASNRQTDVHTEHCCVEHGCKYGNRDCPVETGTKIQSYPCESCQYRD